MWHGSKGSGPPIFDLQSLSMCWTPITPTVWQLRVQCTIFVNVIVNYIVLWWQQPHVQLLIECVVGAIVKQVYLSIYLPILHKISQWSIVVYSCCAWVPGTTDNWIQTDKTSASCAIKAAIKTRSVQMWGSNLQQTLLAIQYTILWNALLLPQNADPLKGALTNCSLNPLAGLIGGSEGKGKDPQ